MKIIFWCLLVYVTIVTYGLITNPIRKKIRGSIGKEISEAAEIVTQAYIDHRSLVYFYIARILLFQPIIACFCLFFNITNSFTGYFFLAFVAYDVVSYINAGRKKMKPLAFVRLFVNTSIINEEEIVVSIKRSLMVKSWIRVGIPYLYIIYALMTIASAH